MSEYYEFKSKSGHRTAEVNEAKIYLKIAESWKYSYLQFLSTNSNTIKCFNLFLCFSEKAYLSIMISRKKVAIETNNRSKQDKNLPKNCQNLQIFTFTMQ